jgi:hypothetical protein
VAESLAYEVPNIVLSNFPNIKLLERPDKATKNLTVHLIPFTETSLGNRKTSDEYYSGTNMAVHHAFVKAELDGIVDTLYEKPDRKFTFANVKYLQMWYTRQN